MAVRYEHMTESQFINWLKGYLEAIDGNNMNFEVYEKILTKLISVKSTTRDD